MFVAEHFIDPKINPWFSRYFFLECFLNPIYLCGDSTCIEVLLMSFTLPPGASPIKWLEIIMEKNSCHITVCMTNYKDCSNKELLYLDHFQSQLHLVCRVQLKPVNIKILKIETTMSVYQFRALYAQLSYHCINSICNVHDCK